MRPAARAGLLLAVSLLAAGCSSRFEAFPFQTAEGRRIDIWQPAGQARRTVPRFQPGDKATPLYRLGSSVTPSGGQAFALTYTSGLRGCELSLYSDRNTVLKTVSLAPTSGNPIRFLVAMNGEERVWGYRVALPDHGSGDFTLEGAGTSRFIHGFSVAGGTLAVDGSVEVRSVSPGSAAVRLPPATRSEMEKGAWFFSVAFAENAGAVRISFDGTDGAHRAFVVDQDAAPPRLDFARGSIGFLPAGIRVTGSIQSLEISEVPPEAPLPADPGLILAASASLWRRPDFELYSWSRFPRVLIFDTASYGVQDGLFNRLAFFVEKAGHAGRIEDPAALEGTHGYNAHDYKADDLARFFATAARDAVTLTPLEDTLLKILLANGVVHEADHEYEPGDGCVLSISRSSNPALRELLLTHESFHGVYFSLPGFRDATARVWASLSPVEQEVWREFLSSQKYDAANNYLVVNEFQAYLLQQDRAAVPGRQALILSRMRAGSSRGARLAAALLAQTPSSFLQAFDALESALRAEGGPSGGRAIAVRPVDPTGRTSGF